jgi:uncharacterized membrane protein
VTDAIRPYAPGASFHLGMRAADADRERAVGVLRAGFAEGRLTKDEYDGRIAAVLAARTYGELGTLTQGLPAGALQPRLSPALRTNKTAIQALKWALFTLPLCFPLAPFNALMVLMFAYEARGEIRRTGQPGGRLALAALVIGYFQIVALVVFCVWIAHISHGGVVTDDQTGGLGQ